MFTHRVPNAKSLFISIRTATGHTITVSPGHPIFVNNHVRTARDVKIGDILSLVAGESAVVQRSLVNMNGLYNPQTLQGNIMVNGILATTYTEAVRPAAAHAALAPLRGLYRLFGFSSAVFEQGSPVQAWISLLGQHFAL
jgi:desert hedgehog